MTVVVQCFVVLPGGLQQAAAFVGYLVRRGLLYSSKMVALCRLLHAMYHICLNFPSLGLDCVLWGLCGGG